MAGAELLRAAARLVAVVELMQIASIVGMQDGGAAVFRRPHDGVVGAISRDAGSCAGINKTIAGLTCWAGRELGVGNLEGFDGIPDCTVEDRIIEVGGHAKYAVAQDSRKHLINISVVWGGRVARVARAGLRN